jgi:hypothetical protein
MALLVGAIVVSWLELKDFRAMLLLKRWNPSLLKARCLEHEGKQMIPLRAPPRRRHGGRCCDAALFNHSDAVDAAWRIIEPILGDATPVYEYECGSWGPEEAGAIASDIGGWDNPLPEEHCHDEPG